MDKAGNELKGIIRTVWPDWEAIEVIGRGSFATVFRASRVNGIEGEKDSAVKVIRIPREDSDWEQMLAEGKTREQAAEYFRGIAEDSMKEIQVMEHLNGHTNIVNIFDYKLYQVPNECVWYILIRMELLRKLDVSLLNTEEEIIHLGSDVCTALSICRQYNIVHRDVSLDNIFVHDGNYKLGDFGVSKIMLGTISTMHDMAGKLLYMAPEIYNATLKETDINGAAKVDIYSLGILLYRLTNGMNYPFEDPDKKSISSSERHNALMRRLSSGETPPPPKYASPALGKVILKACMADPKKRFESAQEMRDALFGLQRKTVVHPNEKEKQKKRRSITFLLFCFIIFGTVATLEATGITHIIQLISGHKNSIDDGTTLQTEDGSEYTTEGPTETMPGFNLSEGDFVNSVDALYNMAQSWDRETIPQNYVELPLVPNSNSMYPTGEFSFNDSGCQIDWEGTFDVPYDQGFLYDIDQGSMEELERDNSDPERLIWRTEDNSEEGTTFSPNGRYRATLNCWYELSVPGPMLFFEETVSNTHELEYRREIQIIEETRRITYTMEPGGQDGFGIIIVSIENGNNVTYIYSASEGRLIDFYYSNSLIGEEADTVVRHIFNASLEDISNAFEETIFSVSSWTKETVPRNVSELPLLPVNKNITPHSAQINHEGLTYKVIFSKGFAGIPYDSGQLRTENGRIIHLLQDTEEKGTNIYRTIKVDSYEKITAANISINCILYNRTVSTVSCTESFGLDGDIAYNWIAIELSSNDGSRIRYLLTEETIIVESEHSAIYSLTDGHLMFFDREPIS